MTDQEFMSWKKDFAARFPDVGSWMNANPATMKVWLSEVFSRLFIEDCIEVNRRLMTQGELDNFDRQKIPAIVSKLAQEIHWKETESAKQKEVDSHRQADRKRKEYKSPIVGSMRQALNDITAWQDAFKVEFGRSARPDERRKWVDDWFAVNEPD